MASIRRDDGLAPEVALLLTLLRAPGAAGAARVPDGIDWPLFLEAVAAHRLSLAVRTDHPAFALLPVPVADHLRAQRAAGTRRALAMAAALRASARALRGAGIKALALKGPAFAALLLGNPAARLSADLDIAVPVADMANAARILAGIGFEPRGPTPAPEQPVQWELVRSADSVVLELHSWPLSTRMDPVTALFSWDNAATVSIGGEDIHTPAPALAIVYAAQHGCRHYWSRLFWLLDIDRAARSPASDWQAILHLARQSGCRHHVLLALVLCNRLLGTPLPAAVRPSRWEWMRVRLLCRLLKPVFAHACHQEQEAAYRVGLALAVLFNAGLRDGPVAMMQALAWYFSPTADDRQAFRLPPALAWLYPLLRVGRLLWRTVGGRERRRR